MKDYDKNKESSYLQCLDVNNLYGWAMSRKLPVKNFKWVKDISKFPESFTKSYNEETDKQVDVQYPEKLYGLHNDLSFSPKRMKIERVEKLVANLHDKTKYVIHIRNLKQALNHRLVLKKFHRNIKFKQKAWLKPYFVIDTDLRKKTKNDFEK